MYTIKVGSGKGTVDGVKSKIAGYPRKVGQSIAKALQEHQEVQISAVGDSAVNNMMKAIIYAQEQVQFVTESYHFEPIRLGNTDSKAVTIRLRLK